MKKIIGLAGLPGSGKGEVGKILKEDHKADVIVISDLFREMAKNRGLNLDDRLVISKISKEVGDEEIVRWTKDKINLSEKELVVVDAIRQIPLFNGLKEGYGEHFKVLGILADQGTRYSSRGGSREDFINTDRRELGGPSGEKIAQQQETRSHDLREIFNRADLLIRNDERDVARTKLKEQLNVALTKLWQ